MKRSLALLATAVLGAALLAGCGGGNEDRKAPQERDASGGDVAQPADTAGGPVQRPRTAVTPLSRESSASGTQAAPPRTSAEQRARDEAAEAEAEARAMAEEQARVEKVNALHDAIAQGDMVAVSRQLVEEPWLEKPTEEGGEAPIHVAAVSGRAEMVRFFLDRHKKDVSVRDGHGNTPLILAAREGHTDIVHMALDYGAKINETNSQGYTALDEAASLNRTEMMDLLLDEGATVNRTLTAGGTPLHVAAWSGNVNAAKVLLDHGAEINIRDEQGRTPLSIARKLGNIGLQKLLVEAGAEP